MSYYVYWASLLRRPAKRMAIYTLLSGPVSPHRLCSHPFAMTLIFGTLFISLLLAVTVHAQSSFIGYPVGGSKVTSGKKFTVQVVRPNSIEGSTEVGLAIALLSCPDPAFPCAPPSAQLGSILYTGPFNPQLHEFGRFYENFTVTVPGGMAKGTAQLSTSRFHLIGAGPSPILEFNNLTLTVV
ncbi:hypothetical protein BDQ12DRAFT_690315 [Crucibulum laeve]|uniref:Uncharacterized protein n=1 Tax=Crucibulum laeve TaxID=68775 RepID=A0A5C3LMP1_9AGAR|nr:hypothetical protein BDQ12DRAFT_690315 [Crucibulum laeve]